MNTTPTTEDRIWSVLSHLSALSFGMGILLPVVGWSDQRRKSNYASFQCLQALGYQSVGFTVWALSYLVLIILASIILLVTFGQQGDNRTSTAALSPGMIVLLLIIFGGFVIYFILPIIAAIACALGKDFRYPILGDRLARYVGFASTQNVEERAWLEEAHEFRWVAAMGHFSILIALWGMLAPLTAWILQGKNSLFLKFQSIQTLVFQGLTTVLYIVGAILYVFGVSLLVFSLGAMGGPDFDSSIGIASTVIMILILLFAAALILFVPLLHILGQWAGYRVLKGENYRYPWIGKLVERWTSQNFPTEEKPV
ncbi:MAG TPA: DUF4870 domain-containing protein [Anaerolineales bacterium]|nr:DUF4870 domain-containing protein [Anaerolineales bacterium]